MSPSKLSIARWALVNKLELY